MDDEISVIAVIKKGTSGIPKRARYHYIRELPLKSVKSMRSLNNNKKTTTTTTTTTTPPKTAVVPIAAESVDVPVVARVIELGDVASKMELRKRFNVDEGESSTESVTRGTSTTKLSDSPSRMRAEPEIARRLPPGTVLIKQEPATPRQRGDARGGDNDDPSSNDSIAGCASEYVEIEDAYNGIARGRDEDDRSTSFLVTSGSTSSSSNGTGNSSSGNTSGTNSANDVAAISRLLKTKRLRRATRNAAAQGKGVVDITSHRRIPTRYGSIKVVAGTGTTTTTTTTTTTMTTMTTMTTTTTTTTTMTTTTRTTRTTTTSTSTSTTRELPLSMSTRPRLRQRLFNGGRNEYRSTESETTGNCKRTRMTTTPYMNTRSVTRKLYTVGATYQAPTIEDEIEWREWPVHGMHERPVFHHQVGLAAEYAGRIFCANWDGPDDPTYREVLAEQQSTVEITSATPRPRRVRGGEAESFAVCMHNSLHAVLAYCALVVDPCDRGETTHAPRTVDGDSRLSDENEHVETAKKDDLNLKKLEDSSISDETLMEMSSIYKKLLTSEEHGSTPQRCHGPNKTHEIARILAEYNENLAKERRTDGHRAVTGNGPTKALPPVLTKVFGVARGVDATWIEDLLVNTGVLYCAATGIRQRDLAEYVDGLDSRQSLRWL